MKQTYSYLGSSSVIGDKTLEALGAEISLDPAEALNALEGGAALLPKEQFPFTADEVKAYKFPAHRASAPEEFKAKFKAALVAVVSHRDALKAQTLNESVTQE